MVKAELYRNSAKGYDILVLDMEQYLSTQVYTYASNYIWNSLSKPIRNLILSKDDIQLCAQYTGIAMKLTGLVPDKKLAIDELLCLGTNLVFVIND